MPTITLTPTAASAEDSSGWVTLNYYKNTSSDYPLTLNLTYPANETLSGGGVNITEITLHGYIRNKSTAIKRLQLGFRPSADAGSESWCQINETNVTGAAFKAVDVSYSGTSYVYNRFSKTYNGTHILTQHVQAAMQAGTPLYLGVIVPDLYRNVSLSLTLSEWTIDVTYELLGNVPTTNGTTAVIGTDSITVTVVKTIAESTTTLIYSGDDPNSDSAHIHRQVDLGTGTSDTFVVPKSIGEYFPAAISYPLTITAVTYVDDVEAGRIDTSVTLTLPDDSSPTVEVSTEPCWAATAPEATAFAAYIQHQSGARFTFAGSARNGASFEEFTLEIENNCYLGTIGEAGELEPVCHLPFSGSGNIPWTLTVTDTRGLTATKTGTITVTPWSPPTIQRFEVYRVTEANVEAIDGTYIRASVGLTASSVLSNGDEKNHPRFHILYREIADVPGEWTAADEVPPNALASVGYRENYRISSSGAFSEWTASASDITGYIPCKTGDIIRIKNMVIPSAYSSGKYWNRVAAYDANKAYLAQTTLNTDFEETAGALLDAVAEDGNIVQFTVKESVFSANVAYIVIDAQDITSESEVYVTSALLELDGAYMLQQNGAAIGGGGLDEEGHDLPFNEMLGYEFQLVAKDIYGESIVQAAIPSAQQFQDIDESTGNMGFGGNAPEAADASAYRFYKQTDFPSGIQIEAQRYGWHAGDSLEISSTMAIPGYITGGTKDCHALLCLGQPIFASSAELSGAVVLRGIKGYVDNMAYSTGVAVGTDEFTFAAEIVNAKAGMVHLSVSKTAAFENATNNTPATMHGAGSQNLVITFT